MTAAEAAAFTRKTQEKLGAIVKKPALTEKLLSRPPFRFLQDVIIAIILSTGFMKEVYSAEELDSKKVLDKKGKIRFLTKAIAAVETVLQTKLDVSPAKVVAGLDPERTNDFLQALATAATSLQKKNGDHTVMRPRPKDIKDTSSQRTPAEGVHIRRRSTDGKTVEDADGRKTRPSRIDKAVNKVDKVGKTNKALQPQREKTTSRTKKRVEEKPEVKMKESRVTSARHQRLEQRLTQEFGVVETGADSTVPEATAVAAMDDDAEIKLTTERGRQESEKTLEDADYSGTNQKKTPADVDIAKISTKVSAENVEIQGNGSVFPSEQRSGTPVADDSGATAVPRTWDVPPSRPSTARRPPSRRQANHPTTVLNLRRAEFTDQPMETNLMIIPQGSKEDEDGAGAKNDYFIVEGDEGNASVLGDRVEEEGGGADDASASYQHGQLVRKILEAKSNLEKEVVKSVQVAQSTLRWSEHVFESHERQKIQQEISALQELLQGLAKTAHPLANALESLGEDTEQMLKECLLWRQEYKRNTALLNQKRKQIDADLKVLENQLRILDDEINEKRKAILALKRNVLLNEQKIAKILRRVCTA